RTEIMFRPGGVAYVYLCYGIHALFNIVTHDVDIPHAILVRAIEPTTGLAHMLRRRGMERPAPRLTAGPGALTAALGITTAHPRHPPRPPRNGLARRPRLGRGCGRDVAPHPDHRQPARGRGLRRCPRAAPLALPHPQQPMDQPRGVSAKGYTCRHANTS